MKQIPAASRHDAGFTLLELLVSMVLLALLAAMLPKSLELGKRATLITAQVSEKATGRATRDWIQKTLTEAMPLLDKDREGALRVSFKGERQTLQFVAPLIGGPRGGGLYRFRFEGQPDTTEHSALFVLRIFPLAVPDDVNQSGRPIEDRVLAKLAAAPTYRYFGQAPNAAQSAWHDAWTRTDRLPDLVEVTMREIGSEADATPLIVELKLRRRL